MPAPFASLYDILLESAMEELGAEHEAASRFARVATQKTSGFFLNLDHVPGTLALNNVRFSDFGFQVEWYSVATFAVCPKCGKITFHKHSKMYYPEQVQDKGVQGRPLWHVINRCKWICDNDQCLQLVFHEQFPGFVEKKCARMTVAFADYVSSIAINTSNRAAVRILRGEGATISKETVGRIVLRRAAPILEDNFYRNAGNVDKVGIDDINLRKGDHSSSCMVIVDLDKRELLGIVRGTTKEDAKKALVMLPNVCIVGRDRGTAMASAANDLDLTSVADGFHITANMHDAIEKTLRDLLPPSIYIPCGTGWVGIANDAESDEVIVSEMASLLTEEDIRLRVRLAHLSPKAELAYTRTLKILELTLQGKHASEISDIIGITIEDVRKLRKNMRETIADVETKIDEFLANPYVGVKKQKSVSASARPSRESKVEPFRGVVVAMRNEGKSHWAIYEELQKLGFEGSHSTVDNYIIKLGRESSIDAEMRETREKTHDFFGATPERPERISVRIYSAKTVYKRLLAQIAEQRKEATDKDPDKQDSIPAKKKKQPNPHHKQDESSAGAHGCT